VKQAPPPPPAAERVFGAGLPAALRYADLLAGPGVDRGLLGPRERERLWGRHILNSAAVAELIPPGARVVDIGSGAGLPGIPLAIARGNLSVTLVEPMARRADFLSEAVDLLGISAEVVRGRAEDPAVRESVGGADAVTSRAVASLDKLARWSLPLLRAGGLMLALKGDRAPEELARYGPALRALGAGDAKVVKCGTDYLDPPATVVMAAALHTSGGPRRRGVRGG
jgi:16S rRNA (guanine527-N7)-methyltransferase